MINVMQPTLGQEELDAIREVFQSNWRFLRIAVARDYLVLCISWALNLEMR